MINKLKTVSEDMAAIALESLVRKALDGSTNSIITKQIYHNFELVLAYIKNGGVLKD